ncbi:hypothetical protein BH10ACT2_BH10ACT2_28970 [soil metagenome]
MIRVARLCGSVVLVGSVLGACSSDNAASTTSVGATNVTVPVAGDTQPPTPTPTGDDLCTTIPDLSAIEAAIGEPVKDPLGIGDAGFQQSCTLLRANDDFPGITFTATPGQTIAAQIEYVQNTFAIAIVPLDGAPGFYSGEGNTVYYEQNGTLYQTGATIAGDSRTASLNMMKVWLGL